MGSFIRRFSHSTETDIKTDSHYGLFRQSLTGNGNLIPMGSSILCYPLTLQCELKLDRDRELMEWVFKPFCNLHGDLTGELMVSCTVNLYVHKFQFPLQCERIGIILIKFLFWSCSSCLNRPLVLCYFISIRDGYCRISLPLDPKPPWGSALTS